MNHPQGWPKYLSNSFVKVGDNGLAHVLLSPGSVKTSLDGSNVSVSCTTAYPFLDTLSYEVTADAAMDFYVRIPAWASASSCVEVGSSGYATLSPDPDTGLHKVGVAKGTTTISLTLSSDVRTESRENDTVAVYKGALLYALEITNTNTSTLPKPYNKPNTYFPEGYAPPQSRDWEYHNTSAWNYAVDPTTLIYHGPDDTSATHVLANPIFAPGAPPGYITAQACQIDWPMFLRSVPGYPPTGDAKQCVGNTTTVRLVPYGSAKTHMAELPVIDLSS